MSTSQVEPKKPCGCRPAKAHRDCMYCGVGWMGEVVCGRCSSDGIDGKVIRGTRAHQCAAHKGKKTGKPNNVV